LVIVPGTFVIEAGTFFTGHRDVFIWLKDGDRFRRNVLLSSRAVLSEKRDVFFRWRACLIGTRAFLVESRAGFMGKSASTLSSLS
jgi:hypothetical protein